ncbi:MAG TPA: biotin/lipoyl-binding protein, partial [Gemmataceae bacterium]|nr:biotin/lipoyl-binding protein [Gemmataceae bacterium]
MDDRTLDQRQRLSRLNRVRQLSGRSRVASLGRRNPQAKRSASKAQNYRPDVVGLLINQAGQVNMDGHTSLLARSKSKFQFGSSLRFWAAHFFALLAASACSKEQAAPAPLAAATPVIVSKVTQKAMPVQLTAIGNVGGYTVSVEAQVSGELLEVHFKEGGFVQKGQLLFTIDPRPYEAVLAQRQATLMRDKAVAANTRAQAQ